MARRGAMAAFGWPRWLMAASVARQCSRLLSCLLTAAAAWSQTVSRSGDSGCGTDAPATSAALQPSSSLVLQSSGGPSCGPPLWLGFPLARGRAAS